MDVQDIYDRYLPDVRRFALYLSGDPAVADDLTSEAFVRLWTARGEIRMPTVKAYLFAIVRNLYSTTRRRERTSVMLDEGTPDPADDVEAHAVRRSELQNARRLLGQLSPEARAALLMRAADMTYEDIASALGISIAAAKVRVHRARLRLAALKQEQEAAHEHH